MEKVERQGLSVVLNGNFNPAIFNPDWLARHDLFDLSETEPKIEVITPAYAKFSVSDFVFEVVDDKFVLHALTEPFVKAGDLVAAIFGRILDQTPLAAMGINYLCHFKVDQWKRQCALGRKLAPIQHWEEWGMKLHTDDLATLGGVTSISMEEKTRGGNWNGHFRVTVEPSRKLDPGTGVFVQTNHHFVPNEQVDLNLAVLCAEQITEALSRSRRMVQSLIDASFAEAI
jgi:hypothetical protein